MAQPIADNLPARAWKISRYPWDEWTDGRVWLARRGEDFEVIPYHLQTRLHGYARDHGLKVITHRDGDTVRFQFFTP